MKFPPVLRAMNVLLAGIFGLFSWFQWNDLDPAVYDRPSLTDAILWGLFYALIGILFLLTLFKRLPTWLLIVAGLFCLVEMGRTAPGVWENLTGKENFTMTQVSMSAEDPRVELSREFFGALIALVGVGILAWERQKFGAGSSGSLSAS